MSKSLVARLLVVLVAFVLAPATAARAEEPVDCGEVTAALQGTTDKIAAALAATPPDPGAATSLLGEVAATVTEAQSAECLPAVPPEGDVTTCVDAVADLLAQTHGALAALISTGPPDVPGAVTQVTALAETVKKLVAEGCLPEPPAPPEPPTPASP